MRVLMMVMAAMLAAPAVAAPTTVVWDQFAPPPEGVVNYSWGGPYSQTCITPGCGFSALLIDDFTLTGSTRLTSLRAFYAGSVAFGGVENWQVDVFSSPTAASGLGAGDVASQIVTAGVSFSGMPQAFPFRPGATGVVTVPIDITLTTGSYWLGLRPKTDIPVHFSVVTSRSGVNLGGTYHTFFNEFAETQSGGAYFQLSGQAVPEPASWAMLITGFGLIGAAARRRRVLAA